jgi:hypothetical protein
MMTPLTALTLLAIGRIVAAQDWNAQCVLKPRQYWSLNGFDIATITGSLEACHQQCCELPECVAFARPNGVDDGREARCVLKSQAFPLLAGSQDTSGEFHTHILSVPTTEDRWRKTAGCTMHSQCGADEYCYSCNACRQADRCNHPNLACYSSASEGECAPLPTCRDSLSINGTCPVAQAGGDGGGFDFGSACDAGGGDFEAFVPLEGEGLVGYIPANKANVLITLESRNDVDIRLYDSVTGETLVHWPEGIVLNGATRKCGSWNKIRICWSGYYGNGFHFGYEFIEISGPVRREMQLKAYGYAAGNAKVKYTFTGIDGCIDQGVGEPFQETMKTGAESFVGILPKGKKDFFITMTSLDPSEDVDIRLRTFDETTGEMTDLVHWPDGLKNGAGYQVLDWNGLVIEWSGYNGDGARVGNEYVIIRGTITQAIVVNAYAYNDGTALVTYKWGVPSDELVKPW